MNLKIVKVYKFFSRFFFSRARKKQCVLAAYFNIHGVFFTLSGIFFAVATTDVVFVVIVVVAVFVGKMLMP